MPETINPYGEPPIDPNIKLPPAESGFSGELGPVDIRVRDEAKIDPDTVKWEWPLELPDDIEYTAAVARPDQEELLLDLLYSSLAASYDHDKRMRLFGIMDVCTRESKEFKRAEHELVVLSTNPLGPEVLCGGTVPGKGQGEEDVIGLILFYYKEVATEAKDDTSG